MRPSFDLSCKVFLPYSNQRGWYAIRPDAILQQNYSRTERRRFGRLAKKNLRLGLAGCGVRATEANFERRVFGEDHFVAARQEVGVHRGGRTVHAQGDRNWLGSCAQANQRAYQPEARA